MKLVTNMTTDCVSTCYDADGEEVNYTGALRTISTYLEDMSTEIDGAWRALETYSTLIVDEDGISEDDREDLSTALDKAVGSLCTLARCFREPVAAVDEALDAFKRLPMSE